MFGSLSLLKLFENFILFFFFLFFLPNLLGLNVFYNLLVPVVYGVFTLVVRFISVPNIAVQRCEVFGQQGAHPPPAANTYSSPDTPHAEAQQCPD